MSSFLSSPVIVSHCKCRTLDIKGRQDGKLGAQTINIWSLISKKYLQMRACHSTSPLTWRVLFWLFVTLLFPGNTTTEEAAGISHKTVVGNQEKCYLNCKLPPQWHRWYEMICSRPVGVSPPLLIHRMEAGSWPPWHTISILHKKRWWTDSTRPSCYKLNVNALM